MDETEIDEYADAVLSAVEAVPVGRVSSYGAIAAQVGRALGRGGPRQVARVMRAYGAAVPWYRIARADGTLAPEVASRQAELLATEGVPVRNGRVPRSFRL
ncbi:MGMT family protein [Epidermidibacterium keratini]|nr:MGMT family protein [Epidermidibacterium keratini]